MSPKRTIEEFVTMLIVFEGIDGSGKSTQAAFAADWLRARFGERVLPTREPGGWDGGEALRELILTGSLVAPWSEFFLFMADRCEHVERVLRPALEAGKFVVCDRYSPSTMAYQLFGGGVGSEVRDYLLGLPDALALPKPDVVFWLDLEVAVAQRRLGMRGDANSFDVRGRDYFERVRAGYEAQMHMQASVAEGGGWIRVDASGECDEISAGIASCLERLVTV